MKKLISITLILFLLTVTLVAANSFSTSSQITVTLLNQDPDPVEQGDVVEVRFKVENMGGETKDDIKIELLPKYPFALYTGTATRNVGKLRAGQTGADAVIVDYKLKVHELAAEGDNEIELQVKSGATTLHSYTKNEFMIDIQQYTTPDLKAYIRQNTVLEPNSKGKVTIEIANVDITDVKFLQFYLLPSEDYELISSSNYVYMGDIDSDDTESEDFEIFVKDSDEISIPVKIEYQDSNENKFEKEFNLSFKVYSSGELAKYGLKERGYTIYVVIIIALLVIWYIWKKRKKNNRR